MAGNEKPEEQNTRCSEALPRRVKQQRKEAKPYYEQLKDPRWQKKRLGVLERDNWQCQACGAKDQTLHVHHMRYRSGCSPWDYEDDELITQCDKCHTANPELMLQMQRWACRIPPDKAESLALAISEAIDFCNTDGTEIDRYSIARFILACGITDLAAHIADVDVSIYGPGVWSTMPHRLMKLNLA
jgi:5-methylcytosine-specific restriction endonuclease McrA